MLSAEYLIFIDNEGIKCNNEKTFNHLLQSNPEISIRNKKIHYKDIIVDYELTFGQIADTERTYFHLVFNYKEIENIEIYVQLLKAIKSVIHIITKTPQTLYDGVSIYYSNLTYPIISDIENIMRKLITKFMLTKVGIDWIKDRTPDDVKSSININNKDLTYLHNVDFIQLKNFLFSENYPIHKENLVKKLKEAKDITELNLDDIKILIPNSNWERYFSSDVSIPKEKLIKNWDELYDLRCKIAHNKSFNITDYKKVITLCNELKPQLEQAINKLSNIQIDKDTRDLLKEEIANNFNILYGDFLSKWRNLEMFVRAKAEELNSEEEISRRRTFNNDLRKLREFGLISYINYHTIRKLQVVRSEILHNSRNLTENEIHEANIDLSLLLFELNIENFDSSLEL